MTDAKRAGEMKQRHDGRVAPSSFEIAHILLREARDLGETLLGEALLPAKSPEIPATSLRMSICARWGFTYYEAYLL